MPANRLHFCHGKTSCGDQETITWLARTFTLWALAHTVRYELLSCGRSPSPTPRVPSIQSLPRNESHDSSWLDEAASPLEWLCNAILGQKAADQVCLSHGLWSRVSTNGPCFLLKGVQNCMLFPMRTHFASLCSEGTQVAAACMVDMMHCYLYKEPELRELYLLFVCKSERLFKIAPLLESGQSPLTSKMTIGACCKGLDLHTCVT